MTESMALDTDIEDDPEAALIQRLLRPISADLPAGPNLRSAAEFAGGRNEIHDLMNLFRSATYEDDRNATSDVAAERNSISPNWRTLTSDAQIVLEKKSKDLQVAAWYAVGLVRARGLAGLLTAINLMDGLLTQYWNSFHAGDDPVKVNNTTGQPNDAHAKNKIGKNNERLKPLKFLSHDAVSSTLYRLPIAIDVSGSAFNYQDYLSAINLDNLSKGSEADRKTVEKKIKEGKKTLRQFRDAVSAGGSEFYNEFYKDITNCLLACQRLQSTAAEHGGDAGPALLGLRKCLNEIKAVVEREAKAMLIQPNPPEELGPDAVGPTASAPDQQAGNGGASPPVHGFMSTGSIVRNREAALRTLIEVADYFRQAEPHSPISASLKEIVRRANLPFEDLLRELAPDVAAWRALLNKAGISSSDTKS